MPTSLPFRFEPIEHEYTALDTGETLPHITGMLVETGWIDDRWFTEESSARGRAVHALTASYDLGALDVATCVSPFRGYLLAHVRAMQILQPTIRYVEEPLAHPRYRFGGRPDRMVDLYGGLLTVLELKSGPPEKSHPVQTALQAILASIETDLPAEMIGRFALYVQDKGRFRLEQHRDRRDFDLAYEIIRFCCGRRR